MEETVLWLLRHPEPEADARGRCYGSLDVALSALGTQQAHWMAQFLASQAISAIYTSPRQRCRQTARIITAYRPCPVEIIDALRELDFGDFEGRSYEEIAETYPELYRQWMERPTETQFPGGENFGQMCARVLEAATRLRSRHAGQSFALVTHGGVIRVLLADALGMPLKNIFRIGQCYGAVNRIRYFGETSVVELVNAVSERSA